MKYFGNFKEFIPKNLNQIILSHPCNKIDFSSLNSEVSESEEVKLWKLWGYDLKNLGCRDISLKELNLKIFLPEDFKEILEIWFTVFHPGDMLPLHRDVYPYNDNSLCRYTMMLQDYSQGHIFFNNDTILQNYKEGDVFVYPDPYDWHGACNIGNSPRLTMQIVSYIK